MDFSEYTNLK